MSLPLAASLPGAGVIAASLAGALVVIALLWLWLWRKPDTLPALAIFALPFRLPISAGGRTVNLLIPLYLVVVAGALAYLCRRLAERRAMRESARSEARRGVGNGTRLSVGGGAQQGVGGGARQGVGGGAPERGDDDARRAGAGKPGRWLSARGLEWLLLASVVLYALQTAYSSDPAKAAENVAFFYVPFGVLFVLLKDVRFTRELTLACLTVAIALAVLFAGVGFVEYYRKALFLNPKVVAANQYDNYFRVNSVFFDPSIYGRFLALVMIAVTTFVLWGRTRREVALGAALLAWLMAGLVTSFSQSSIAALLLGLAVLAAYRWDVRATIYAAAALVAIAAVVLLAAPPSLHFGLNGSGASTNNATSGRANLISGGLDLFAKRPLYGYGSGSFETEYKRHSEASAENATSASHTIPITVGAEQGVVGLALYVALLVVALSVLFSGARGSPPRIAVAACFVALVAHTWMYADFLEDPITWTLLGIGVAFARSAPAVSRSASAFARSRPAIPPETCAPI